MNSQAQSLLGIQHICGHWQEHDTSAWPSESPTANVTIWLAQHPCDKCRSRPNH